MTFTKIKVSLRPHQTESSKVYRRHISRLPNASPSRRGMGSCLCQWRFIIIIIIKENSLTRFGLVIPRRALDVLLVLVSFT